MIRSLNNIIVIVLAFQKIWCFQVFTSIADEEIIETVKGTVVESTMIVSDVMIDGSPSFNVIGLDNGMKYRLPSGIGDQVSTDYDVELSHFSNPKHPNNIFNSFDDAIPVISVKVVLEALPINDNQVMKYSPDDPSNFFVTESKASRHKSFKKKKSL